MSPGWMSLADKQARILYGQERIDARYRRRLILCLTVQRTVPAMWPRRRDWRKPAGRGGGPRRAWPWGRRRPGGRPSRRWPGACGRCPREPGAVVDAGSMEPPHVPAPSPGCDSFDGERNGPDQRVRPSESRPSSSGGRANPASRGIPCVIGSRPAWPALRVSTPPLEPLARAVRAGAGERRSPPITIACLYTV